MNVINAPQGSAEWLAVRAQHFTASEAPAMMGASKYVSRQELLRQKHTGLAAEVDEGKQRLFDRGHEAEAAARPIVEAIIGDDLSPMTGALEIDGLPLLASFDGVTQGRDIVWESKLWNAILADAVRAGQLEAHYYWQLEQQLLVSGAERAYFTASDGTTENTVGMWYASYPERRAALIAGWKQFAEDLANYQHVELEAAPVAATIEALPALFVQVEGKVLATNLDAFKQAAQTFIDGIRTELVTDQHFADADKMVKFLKDGEERLALAKSQALAQTASIDELFRTVDAISEQMRSKRLALDRLVKSEKEARRAAIVVEAQNALMEHRAALTKRIGGNWLPAFVPGMFADSIKGLKSLDSMRDKVATALANAKIEANEIADRIEFNARQITVDGANYNYLVHDFAQICTKATEDFAAIMAQRIAAHKAAEAEKAEAAKKAEEARIAAAVEAERKAGEARAEASKIEAERAAKQAEYDAVTAKARTEFDQRGKADAGMGLDSSDQAQPEAAITTPVQDVAGGFTAGDMADQAAKAFRAGAATGATEDRDLIDDFLRLLAISAVEKKALRTMLIKFETYRIKVAAARELATAA